MDRPLPPELPTDPAILCVWCVGAAYTARAMFQILTTIPLTFAMLADCGDRRGDDSQPGQPLMLHPQRWHSLHELAGWPLGWAAFLAELAAQPAGSWKLEVDMSHVGAIGNLVVSGTRVCATHVQAELTARREGYRR